MKYRQQAPDKGEAVSGKLHFQYEAVDMPLRIPGVRSRVGLPETGRARPAADGRTATTPLSARRTHAIQNGARLARCEIKCCNVRFNRCLWPFHTGQRLREFGLVREDLSPI